MAEAPIQTEQGRLCGGTLDLHQGIHIAYLARMLECREDILEAVERFKKEFGGQ
jgi:hypothetical protein